VRNLQPTDECECRDIFTAVEKLGKLSLKALFIRLEVVTLPLLNEEEVVIILLGIRMGGVLGEEYLSNLRKIVEQMQR